ncbi:MAG: ribokinase [Akkermansiaceae bacterium]|nr:ribokinase [Akkermansiaceae bacterium]|tara:strand:+ start:1456 stop:2346 length:891 start_codon:yes stop_codon:yes gene_type:complete
MSVLVVGSLCLDHTLFVSSLPGRGETAIAKTSLVSFGGKGANQAFAAKRAGGEVGFVAMVGDDEAGEAYREHFMEHGISTEGIISGSDHPTGSAFLGVEDSGENLIIINPGANHTLRPSDLDRRCDLFAEAEILLLQLEIPLETIAHACQLAKDHKLTTIINPSPWDDSFNTADFPCDILILNEHEMATLVNDQRWKLDSSLLDRLGIQTLIVTRGSKATLAVDGAGKVLECKPPMVTPVDTVGAGDAFTGAFAVALAEGKALEEAIHFANRAASLSTLKPGAQGATPTRSEIDSA